MHEQLEGLAVTATAQAETVNRLFASHSPAELGRRPTPKKWSAAEHVEHLNATNGLYLGSIEASLREATNNGWTGGAPFGKGPRIAEWLISSQEPPPRQNLPTFKSLKPKADFDQAKSLERFLEGQARFERALSGGQDVDLSRATFRSPLLWLVKLTAFQGFRLILSHNSRHIWHMERALSTEI